MNHTRPEPGAITPQRPTSVRGPAGDDIAAGGRRAAPDRRLVALGLGATAVALVVPALLSDSTLVLLTQGISFGIAVLGIEVILGKTGLISFGHAGFVGIGAYTTALMSRTFTDDQFVPAVLAGIFLTVAVAWLLGLVILRLDGLIFAIMTLIIGQLLFTLALKARFLTGGEDGLGGLPFPAVLAWDFDSPLSWTYVVLIIALGAVVGVGALMRTPFGRTLVAIRENPERASLIGINVRRHKLVSWMLMAALGALAGGLLVFSTGLISPASMHWSRSGDYLLIGLLGGLGTIVGPFIAGVAWVFTESWLRSLLPYWEIPFGVLVMAVVIFFPGGVGGLVSKTYRERIGR